MEEGRMRGWALGALVALVAVGAVLGGGPVAARAPRLARVEPGGSSGDQKATSSPGLADGEVGRLAGGERFATSAEAARRLWPDGADTVVLATGLDYPDALAGAPLAAAADAPMLLAATDRLPEPVRRAIVDLAPQRVVLLGGEAVLSPAVAETVAGLPGRPAVERVAGPNRFATAEAAARATGGRADGDVAVAGGSGFADALAAGALAAGDEPTPVVLASEARVEADVAGADRALLVGALSSRAEQDARARADAVRRVAGPTRWATSRAVADMALTERLTGDAPLVVATGERFADALAAGAVAARRDAPLLLVPADGVTRGQAEWIATHHRRLTGAWIVGGTGAVTVSAADDIAALIAGDDQQPRDARQSVVGVLDGDAQLEGGCVWLDAANGLYHVRWPEGWRASADPVELRNPQGQVVARRGDRVEVGGEPVEDAVTACQRGSVFDADEVRPF
jgi:putative cell wall-binding protein